MRPGLIVVDGLLEWPGFHLHLHRTPKGLAIGIGLGGAQDMLHWARVVDLGGQFRSIEEVSFHEVLVSQHLAPSKNECWSRVPSWTTCFQYLMVYVCLCSLARNTTWLYRRVCWTGNDGSESPWLVDLVAAATQQSLPRAFGFPGWCDPANWQSPFRPAPGNRRRHVSNSLKIPKITAETETSQRATRHPLQNTGLLRSRLEVVSTTSKALHKLLFSRLLCSSGGVISTSLLCVGQHVVGFVQHLELLGVSALVWMLCQDFGTEFGPDLM